MKKIFSIAILCSVVLAANAIPARRGWLTHTQADGTTIEVQQLGDEYYHYMVNRDGQQVRENENGMFEVVGEAPTAETAQIRRAAAKARRIRQEVGVTPYPAPRGLLILVNFSDVSFKSANSVAVMDSLITAENCQVNNGHGSAAQYFRDQSNGQYKPQFDVYGPVTLSQNQSYYGQNIGENDKYATDAVIEACILANEQYEDLDFSNYDWNNDGYVDFVYVIYAGKGEADTQIAKLIWPHNWSIQSCVEGDWYSSYTKADTKLDGKYLDNYAMSQELNGWDGSRAGNGVFCHEFGHVIGLPDFYDTNYGTNYNNQLTPNEWDIMDGGGYNGDGHCPPNYSVWEKYFMGWIEPENLGEEPALLTLYPNGSEQYNTYQINASGEKQAATKEGLNYYIECRQKKGWDAEIPAAGMLIWKVNFNSNAWSNNTPNNTANNPKYTLIIPSGTKIGTGYGSQNVWPYNSKNSWEGVSGKPLKDIKKEGNTVTLTYIDVPVTAYIVKWVVDGEVVATQEYALDGSEDLVLPDVSILPCTDNEVIKGWTTEAEWADPFTLPEDLFREPSGKVTENATYHAVFQAVEPMVD